MSAGPGRPGRSGPVDLVVVAARAVVEDAGPPGGGGPAGPLAAVERPATVVVDGGRVVAVLPGPGTGTGTAPAARTVVALADDEVLLPGLVDTHVHVNEPGRTAWEGFATATRAAALGGVTTVVDMPLNSVPPTVDVAALRAKREAARGQVAVDVGFWGGAVPASLGRLAPLHDAGVFGFKAFLVDSGVPEFPPLDPAGLRDALAEVAALGSVLVVHAEDPDVLAGAPAVTGPRFADFVASRPSAAEVRAVERVVDAAREAGARVHVLHVASGDALAVLAAARRDGVAVTAETCPHYLTLTADAVPDGATEFKCCPPIRSRRDQDLLWEGLTGGVLDVVVSDHSPCTPDLKRREAGDFAVAWGGIASLQLGLPLVWTAARERGLSLAEVSRWMARRPAELFGIPGKGRIAPGADADLVVLAPDATFRVDPGRLAHRHPVTPYAGRELAGVVRRVWLRGVPVGPTAEREASPTGRLLRKPSPAGADQAQDAS